jgi:hypothetical protein
MASEPTSQEKLQTYGLHKAAAVLSLFDLVGSSKFHLVELTDVSDEAEFQTALEILEQYNDGLLERNEAYFRLADIYAKKYTI